MPSFYFRNSTSVDKSNKRLDTKPTVVFFSQPTHRNSSVISKLIFLLRFGSCIGTLQFLFAFMVIVMVRVISINIIAIIINFPVVSFEREK